MTTYYRREVCHTRVEFLVPAHWRDGAMWTDVAKVINTAVQEMRASGRLGPNQEPSDDAIKVRPGDGELIVFYETEKTVSSEGGGSGD